MTTTQIENATVTIETTDSAVPAEVSATDEGTTGKKQRAVRRGPAQEVVSAMLDEHLDETFDVVAQNAFLRIKGKNGHRIYVSLAKQCRQVDISFNPPEGLASLCDPRRENGRVQAELDTEHPDFLADLATLVEWMKTAPEQEDAKPRAKFAPRLPIIAQKQAQVRSDAGIHAPVEDDEISTDEGARA